MTITWHNLYTFNELSEKSNNNFKASNVTAKLKNRDLKLV